MVDVANIPGAVIDITKLPDFLQPPSRDERFAPKPQGPSVGPAPNQPDHPGPESEAPEQPELEAPEQPEGPSEELGD